MAGVLQNQPEGGDKNDAQVTFNEQTNYVPKRTIITVSCFRLNAVWLLTWIDLFSMLQCRFAGLDGPDHLSRQFVHHWQCPRG